MKHLDVFSGDALVGRLGEGDAEGLAFAYAAAWLANRQAVPLSPDLPLSEHAFHGQAVTAYFDNLLPEGSVREFIAKAAHISPGNVFGLLERFGGDTAGALSLLPAGQRPSEEPRYLPVTAQQIRHWFETSRGLPLDLGGLGDTGGGQARMSLSGAQDKMAVFIGADGGMAIPLGAAPSTHIIKPSVGHRSDLPNTAVNEALVMALARAAGLDVPEVRFLAEMDAVLVSRYDRKAEGGGIRRLHQIDLCQAMGLPPGKKYESEGGPSFKACFDAVAKHSAQPGPDKNRLIEWVVFNVLAGNMDSHAKNVSLLAADGGKTRLAPFYDMLCTTVYPNLSHKFAFKIGGENRPQWMMARHWERFAEQIGTTGQFLAELQAKMAERVGQALPVVAASLRGRVSSQSDLAMIDRVEGEIRRAVATMKSRLGGQQPRIESDPGLIEKDCDGGEGCSPR